MHVETAPTNTSSPYEPYFVVARAATPSLNASTADLVCIRVRRRAGASFRRRARSGSGR